MSDAAAPFSVRLRNAARSDIVSAVRRATTGEFGVTAGRWPPPVDMRYQRSGICELSREPERPILTTPNLDEVRRHGCARCPLSLIKPRLGHFGTRASERTFFCSTRLQIMGSGPKIGEIWNLLFLRRGPPHTPPLAFLLDHPPPSEIGRSSGRLASSSLNSRRF
jgi:hypothetical protein